MPPCRRDFHAPLGAFLAEDIGKVHVIGPGGPFGFLPQGFPVTFRIPDQEVGGVLPLFQDAEHVVQCADAEDQRLAEIHGLQGRPFRQDGPFESAPDRQFHHGQGSRHVADAPVQAQLAHNEVLFQSGQLPLPRGGDDSEGDGQVVTAALLVQVGGGQVDDDFLSGDAKALRLQGRHRPEEALLHRGVSESDQVDSDAEGDFHFHHDRDRFDSDALRSVYIDQHIRFSPNLRKKRAGEGKKRKNVAKCFRLFQ